MKIIHETKSLMWKKRLINKIILIVCLILFFNLKSHNENYEINVNNNTFKQSNINFRYKIDSNKSIFYLEIFNDNNIPIYLPLNDWKLLHKSDIISVDVFKCTNNIIKFTNDSSDQFKGDVLMIHFNSFKDTSDFDILEILPNKLYKLEIQVSENEELVKIINDFKYLHILISFFKKEEIKHLKYLIEKFSLYKNLNIIKDRIYKVKYSDKIKTKDFYEDNIIEYFQKKTYYYIMKNDSILKTIENYYKY